MTSADTNRWWKNPFTAFLVALYNNPAYHWFVAIPLAPFDWLFGLLYRLLNRIWPILYWKQAQGGPEPHFPLPETRNDLPVKPEACDACGKYLSTMIGTYVDADRLSKLLPPGTSLDPAHIHDGKHSLVLMFGYTQNLKRVFWPFSGMTYLEFLVGVPNLQLDTNQKYITRFFYLPVLHLNRFYPTLLGWLVGYRKRWSRMEAGENTYTIRTLFSGKKILEAKFGVDAALEKFDGQHWEDLLNQPQVNPFGDDKLFLHFHWDWDDAAFRPVTADLTLYEEIPGMSPGTYHFQSIEVGQWRDGMAPEGSIRIVCPFELLAPFSLSLLKAKQDQIDRAAKAAAQ